MSTTYGRSPGGYVWALAEPIGGILVMTVIFSMIARNPPLGDNFPFYFATGILPFMMYQSISSKVSQSIRYSRPLLAYPGVTYVDAIIARLLLSALTEILITILMIALIAIYYGLQLKIDYIDCVRAFAMAITLGFGVGVVNCYLTSMFPIWQFIWAVANRPLFIVSGVFFLIDPFPENIRTLLLYNPLAHPIMMMRRGAFDTYDAVYMSELYVYLVALALAALGMLLLHRFHRIILDEGA
ncbi:ABC transporter permease (plasmid) [Thalassovita gelatinovora]|nr:ABC transporter permease [Thalassovita gelatinovora]